MSGLTLREAIPTNFKNSYSEYDNVDFNLAYEGESLVLGSVRIEGVLKITNNGLPLNDNTGNDPTNFNRNINIDHNVGAHAFFDQITTETNAGVIESVNHLPRYAKMCEVAKYSQDDYFNSENICELKTSSPNFTNRLLKGEIPTTQPTDPIRIDPDFSIKPHIALNSRDGLLPYRRTGDVRMSLSLTRVAGCIYGQQITTGNNPTTYTIEELRITYRTRPDDGSNDPVELDSKLSVVSSVQSSFANLDIKVPAVVDSVSCSFNIQSQVNSPVYNNLNLIKVPQLSQTQFLVNDSTNKLISFVLRDDQEVISRYIDSFMDTGKNQMSRNTLENNNGFGIGINFGGPQNLINKKFAIQIQSGVSNSQPLTMFSYFHSIINI